jgi:NADP-reducing hydrogenase subunit HndB
MKLKPEDLEKISDNMRSTTSLRDGAGRAKITVHMGTCGIASGAREIMKAFLNKIQESNVTDVIFTTSGCAGLCSHEPMVTVELKDQAPIKYIELTEEKVNTIFQKHVIDGNIVEEYALAKGSERLG